MTAVNGARQRQRGERFEKRAADQLRTAGYWVWQSRGSRSPADLVALRPGSVLLVQCKSNTTRPTAMGITGDDWNALHNLAARAGGLPLLADRDPEHPTRIRWQQITGPHEPHAKTWACRVWTPNDLMG